MKLQFYYAQLKEIVYYHFDLLQLYLRCLLKKKQSRITLYLEDILDEAHDFEIFFNWQDMWTKCAAALQQMEDGMIKECAPSKVIF